MERLPARIFPQRRDLGVPIGPIEIAVAAGGGLVEAGEGGVLIARRGEAGRGGEEGAGGAPLARGGLGGGSEALGAVGPILLGVGGGPLLEQRPVIGWGLRERGAGHGGGKDNDESGLR